MSPKRSFVFVFLLLLAGGGTGRAQTPAAPGGQSADRQALAARNLRESEEFLAANAKRPGVFTTYKGLQYEILKPGKGPTPHSTDKVTISFEWSRTDGTKLPVMDSGAPITVRADQLIEGFTAAVQLMPLHAKWRIWLPPALAFGEAGRGELLGPNTVLVIDCEIFGIRPAESRFPGNPPARPPG
jgi:FKBP-type peptidyl-prolyl cis-trans isomerase